MREQIPAIIPDSKAELHILDREEAKEEANDRPD